LLNQWIHYILTKFYSLGLVNSLKFQWNHLIQRETFCCSESKVLRCPRNQNASTTSDIALCGTFILVTPSTLGALPTWLQKHINVWDDVVWNMSKENIKLPNKLMANSLSPEYHAHGYKSTWLWLIVLFEEHWPWRCDGYPIIIWSLCMSKPKGKCES
jgi:hypothetical protein